MKNVNINSLKIGNKYLIYTYASFIDSKRLHIIELTDIDFNITFPIGIFQYEKIERSCNFNIRSYDADIKNRLRISGIAGIFELTGEEFLVNVISEKI